MSRRPSDTFTRFTANSPHAAHNPSFDSRSVPQHKITSNNIGRGAQPGAGGETPTEKVARLRAAARTQREAQFSTSDKILARGRIWADVAHRFTAFGLIGLAGISAVVGTYGVFSLIGHNRRQKRAWIEREMDRLAEAQRAFLRGDANAEQLHLLEQERAGDEMAAKFKSDHDKKKSESLWSKAKGFIGKGAAAGEMGRETETEIAAAQMRQARREKVLDDPYIEGEIRPVAVRSSGIEGVGFDSKGRPVPANKMERVVRKVEDERRIGEGEIAARTGVRKGPLDVMADNISATIVPQKSSSGWFSWGKDS